MLYSKRCCCETKIKNAGGAIRETSGAKDEIGGADQRKYSSSWEKKEKKRKTAFFRKVLTLPPMTRILIPGRADTMEGNSGSSTVYYEGPFG